MKTLKLLLLATATVVLAACNGTSSTSPNAIVASDDATALAEATASKGRAIPPDPSCHEITAVKLTVLRSPGSARVEAQYLYGDGPGNCTIAPAWSSRPSGRLRYSMRTPFVVGVILTLPPSTVQVTAKAPNGVQSSILLR